MRNTHTSAATLSAIVRHIASVGMCGCLATFAAVALAAPSLPTANELAQQAFAKSKSAETAGDFSAVIALSAQALELKPNQATAQYVGELAAWAHNRRGELRAAAAAKLAAQNKAREAQSLEAEALADFEQALEYDSRRWKAFHNRAVSLAQMGRFQEALADTNTALTLHADYAPTWFNRAELYLELGQFEAAARDYNQCLKRQPNDAAALVGRGRAAAGMKQYRAALADYDRAATLEANFPGLTLERAEAHAALGEPEKAAPLFQWAMQNERSARAFRASAWFMATCADERFVDANLAVKCAEKARTLEAAADYRTLHTLAAAYLAARQPASAKTALRQAIELAPAQEAKSLSQQLEQLEITEEK